MSDDVSKKTIFNLRVLDEDALREQAEKLKSLIDEAASSSRDLDEMIESGRKVNAGASTTKGELQERLQLGGRVLKAMETELDRVDQVLGGLGERQQQAEEASAKLHGRLSDLDGRLDIAVSTVDKRVTVALDDLDAHRQSTERARTRLEHLLEAASALGDRFREIQAQLASGMGRFEEGLEKALEGIESGKGQAERVSSHLDDQIFSLKARVNDFAGCFDQMLKPALAEIETWRHDADRANQERQRQLAEVSARFDQSIRSLEERIDSGLVDLGGRHESNAQGSETMRRQVEELHGRLSTCIEEWERQGRDMNEQTLERLRPVVEQLKSVEQQASATQSTLLQRFAELQDQVQAAVGRVESQVTPALREQLGAVTAQLDGRISALQESLKGGDDTSSLIERRFADLQERVVAALAGAADQSRSDGSNSVKLDHHFDDLRAQLTALNTRIETKIEPALAALQEGGLDRGGIDRKVEEQLTDFQGQFAGLAERLENRMAEAIGEIEVRTTRIELDASKDPSQVVDLNKQLSTLVGRMEDRVVAAVRDGGGGDHHKLVEQVAGLESQLATIGGRLESRLMEAVGEIAASAAAGTPAPTIDVQAQMSGIMERMERRIVAAIGQRASGSGDLDGRIEQRLTDLRQHLDANFARLEGRLEPALTAMQERPESSGDASKDYLRDVGDLQAQLTEVRKLLEAGRSAPVELKPVRPAPALPDSPSGRLVKECLEAINSGDADILRTFVTRFYADSALKSRSADDRTVVYLRIYEESGGITLRRVEKCGLRNVVVFVEQKTTSGWYRCQFELEPTAPHKIVNVYIDPVEPLDDDDPPS